MVLPGGDFFFEGRLVWNAAAQALTRQDAEFGFGHVDGVDWSKKGGGGADPQIQSELARPRIFDGAAEAKLIALTCSPAPEGFARWSLRLLEEKVVELNIVEKASDNTIGRTLKKTSSSPTAIGNG